MGNTLEMYGKTLQVEDRTAFGLRLDDIPREELVERHVLVELVGQVVRSEPTKLIENTMSVIIQYENALGTSHFSMFVNEDEFKNRVNNKLKYRQDFLIESYNKETDTFVLTNTYAEMDKICRLEVPAVYVMVMYAGDYTFPLRDM